MPVTLLRKGKLSRREENGLKNYYLDMKKDKRSAQNTESYLLLGSRNTSK